MVRSEYGKESVFFSAVLQARWIHRMRSFAPIKDEFSVKEGLKRLRRSPGNVAFCAHA